MKKLDDLEYLKLNKWQKFTYKLGLFFAMFPTRFCNFFKKIGLFFKKIGLAIGHEFADLGKTFVKGDWKTKVSYVIMGFGNIARGQVLRGILFFLFEAAFIVYMILAGGYWLGKLPTLGTVASIQTSEMVEIAPGVIIDTPVTKYYDNSFKILLYGVLTIFFIVAFIYTWRLNIKQNKINEMLIADNKKLESTKDDLHAIVDKNFHKTLLALPTLGITAFTILPIIFMILIAFTNYDAGHTPPTNLFGWVGFQNFEKIFSWSSGGNNFSATFGEVLSWTLIWAFFATFTNYFLGMFVAMMINKKGIKLKKMWRTILVVTIAIPQFISLLFVSKMFADNGIVNGLLNSWGLKSLPFWTDKNWARATVIIINIWIGIPYLMLITTGILMNIPKDLYESARIDGANGWQTYTKITLPYMLFVTGPYLLTSFIANMNNFNVIFLLTGGAPLDVKLTGGSGYTDLLVTWLFKLTLNDSDYKTAAVIGIMVFLVVSIISLIVYNLLPSNKNEEDFQ